MPRRFSSGRRHRSRPHARVVFVGVLERYKAFDTLVRAWRDAAPRVPGAVLHLVGDGSMRADAEQLLADLPAQVEWTPRLDAEGVAAAMDASWVVALPSRSEGLPRVALEAACRGRAIAAGTAPGFPTSSATTRTDCSSIPTTPTTGCRAPRILEDRALAERYGAAARATGEAWGVTPREYAAKVLAPVQDALAA